jgi:ATP-binding cassette, subfamily B, heavy metal transporter
MGKLRGFRRVATEDLEAARSNQDGMTASMILMTMLPYLWPSGQPFVKLCGLVSLVLMVLQKLSNVAIPIAMKHIINDLSDEPIHYPIWWILAYGSLLLTSKAMGDIRDSIFMNVSQSAVRQSALETFTHLHCLSLRFHIHRQTGGVLRAIERGTQAVSFLLTFLVFNIVPTLLEILMVCAVLFSLYEAWFAVITLVTLITYIGFTFGITQVCCNSAPHDRLDSTRLVSLTHMCVACTDIDDTANDFVV